MSVTRGYQLRNGMRVPGLYNPGTRPTLEAERQARVAQEQSDRAVAVDALRVLTTDYAEHLSRFPHPKNLTGRTRLDYLQYFLDLVDGGEWVQVAKLQALVLDATALLSQSAPDAPPPSPSTHQGAVGARVTLSLRYDRSIGLDPVQINWSTTNYPVLYLFSDEQSNVYTWKASNDNNVLTDAGQVYQVTGTVKEHTRYRGIAQTVLTRCKVVNPNTGTNGQDSSPTSEQRSERRAEQRAALVVSRFADWH